MTSMEQRAYEQLYLLRMQKEAGVLGKILSGGAKLLRRGGARVARAVESGSARAARAGAEAEKGLVASNAAKEMEALRASNPEQYKAIMQHSREAQKKAQLAAQSGLKPSTGGVIIPPAPPTAPVSAAAAPAATTAASTPVAAATTATTAASTPVAAATTAASTPVTTVVANKAPKPLLQRVGGGVATFAQKNLSAPAYKSAIGVANKGARALGVSRNALLGGAALGTAGVATVGTARAVLGRRQPQMGVV